MDRLLRKLIYYGPPKLIAGFREYPGKSHWKVEVLYKGPKQNCDIKALRAKQVLNSIEHGYNHDSHDDDRLLERALKDVEWCRKPILDMATGKIYSSITTLLQLVKVSRTTVFLHCNGRSNNPRFKYITQSEYKKCTSTK